MSRPNKGLSIVWSSHLRDTTEAAKFNEYVLSSLAVLERLRAVLEDKKHTRQVFKEEDYKQPSWAFEAADRNGYVRALNEVISIISVNQS